jgi:hypothetical protein
MVNSIPQEYIIFDIRSTKEFSKLSFSKYLLKDVVNALNKSLVGCKLEEAINWTIELLISGHINKFWERVLTIGIKNININNPHMGFFLYDKYSKHIELLGKSNILSIRNNQCYRNLIAETCFIICNSLKTKSLGFDKIKDSDFNMHYLETKILANSPDLINDKLKYGDPNETKIILNEFNYCLINRKYELCVYWLSWILEWEKKNTKKDKMYACGYREIKNVEPKYYNDLVWLIWEIILKEGVKTQDDFVNKNIQALYKLYKFDFKASSKSKKSTYLLFAIKYFTDNYHISSTINNYNLLVQVCLNINVLFFEKSKLSIKKCSNTDITNYKQNVSNIKNTIKTKEVVSKTSLDRKKLLELKKIADDKMKLKINTVEEIDSLILNK